MADSIHQLIAEYKEQPDFKKHQVQWNALYETALHTGEWEMARELDLLKASWTRDKPLIIHLYFGTPEEGFRQKIFQTYGERIEIPDEYHWSPGEGEDSHRRTARLFDPNADEGLPPGGILYRLAATLCSDFYRPFTTERLSTLLYPNEPLPESSKAKIYEGIKCLRKHLLRHSLSIGIRKNFLGYQLYSHNSSVLIPHRRFLILDPLISLKGHYEGKEFSRQDVMRTLFLSEGSAKEFLKRNVVSGTLIKTGQGPATRYQFDVTYFQARASSNKE